MITSDRVFFAHINCRIGFFAQLSWCLELMLHCDQRKQLPYFLLTELYADPARGNNWFTYFFEYTRISPRALRELDETVRATPSILNVIDDMERFQTRQNAPAYESLLTFDAASQLFNRYIRIKDEIIWEAATWSHRYLGDRPILGVHYRGTDKSDEAPHVARSSFLSYVESKIATGRFRTLFVATDEQAFEVACAERFQNRIRVASRSSLRVQDDSRQPLHHRPGLDPYLLGRDALLDCLLLSHCDEVLKTASFLSGWAKIFRPTLAIEIVNPPHRESLWFPDRLIPTYRQC